MYPMGHPAQTPTPSRAQTPLLNGSNQYTSGPFLDVHELEQGPLTYRTRMKPGRNPWTEPTVFKTLTSDWQDVTPMNDGNVFSKNQDKGSSLAKETDLFYPMDEPGEEVSELARVWRVYLDEAAKYDSTLTEGSSRGIDVLLVFTGLFSAVLTTFIIQSYQLMLPDTGETTNALLVQLIVIQANSNGIIPPPVPKDANATSPGQMHWVNGLWFAALSCGLSTALISMLSKQWLQAYTPNISGSPRHRARQRQSRYMQLKAWHVLALINALPLLLHAALLLFFAGLIVLLWSVDVAITIATWIIVASAYAVYAASIWLPFVYPDCPYQHPISDHLRRFLSPSIINPSGLINLSTGESLENQELLWNIRSVVPSPNDKLDASALVWLFTGSTDKHILSVALQAIAGLPHDFTAIYILRDAGALHLVEQGFQSCFEKDATVDLKWHLIDPDGAWLYCRAWINLTWGTTEQWPLDLLDPLWKLQDLKGHPDVTSIASCIVAISSFDSYLPQWELLGHLSRHVSGEVQLTHSTVCCLLDSIIESLAQWEMPTAVTGKTAVKAVPVLLCLLQQTEDLPMSNVRSAAALALYIFTDGPINLLEYRSEDRRRTDYCELMLASLSAIAANPVRFEVEDSFLDLIAQELSRLASPVVSHPQRFSSSLRDTARASLFELFMAGRIRVGSVPDTILADVLHLLNQVQVNADRQPAFITILVKMLWRTSHVGITSRSIRLLKPILSGCSISVIEAFTENNGINAILRAAKSGDIDIDSRRLLVDSWRTLRVFVNTSTALYEQGETSSLSSSESQPHADYLFEPIFKSNFFGALCAVITSRRWWLLEGPWVPTLVNLCRLRSDESLWRPVIRVIQDVSEKGQESDVLFEIMDQLDAVLQTSPRSGEIPLDGDDGTDHIVTMMEQRSTAAQINSLDLSDNASASAWFGP